MKYILALAIPVIVLQQLAAIAKATDRDVRGIDLVIEACRWQGLNPAMIRSGYAEFDVIIKTPNKAESEIQKEIAAREASVRQAMKDQKDEKSLANWEVILNNLPNVVRAYSAGRRSRVKVLFGGNNPETGKRRSEIINYDPVSEKWDRPMTILRNGLTKKGEDTAIWRSSQNMAVVNDRGYNVIDFQAFGRIRGTPSMMLTGILLHDSDPQRFEFLPEVVEKLKTQYEDMAKSGKVSPFHLAGETTYDGDAVAQVVESQVTTQSGVHVTQRYWIDASRGYICPLVQLFTSDGKLAEEWASKAYFLHEQSGLWFPTETVHTQYVPATHAI